MSPLPCRERGRDVALQIEKLPAQWCFVYAVPVKEMISGLTARSMANILAWQETLLGI
jgi:hypothetical protein